MASQKILLLSENWPPQPGGIQRYLFHLIRYLSLAQFKVTAVVPKGQVVHKKKDCSPELTGGINVISKKFFYSFLKPAWLPLYWFLKRRAASEKWDVTLCGKGLCEGLIAYMLKKKFGIPYIVFTYAMEVEVWNSSFWQRTKLRKVLRAAERVVYINDITKGKLVALGIKECQLVQVQPGVDSRFFKQLASRDISAILKKYDLRQPYILSVGRLIARKGFSDLINAFAKFDQTVYANYSLVIVGDGPQLNNLEEQAKEELLDTSVIFLPEVPDEDLPALYAGAELFVLTPVETATDMEGFGMVYLEAAAQGLAAVASQTGGVAEAVIDGQTGYLVKPGNPVQTAEAITTLLQNKAERIKLGEQGRARVLRSFNWEQQTKKLIDAINQI